jgi:hypothetical protein
VWIYRVGQVDVLQKLSNKQEDLGRTDRLLSFYGHGPHRKRNSKDTQAAR